MKKLPPHELPCITDSKILQETARGQVAWALHQMIRNFNDVELHDVKNMPHEHLWRGGNCQSDEWLKAVLGDIKKEK